MSGVLPLITALKYFISLTRLMVGVRSVPNTQRISSRDRCKTWGCPQALRWRRSELMPSTIRGQSADLDVGMRGVFPEAPPAEQHLPRRLPLSCCDGDRPRGERDKGRENWSGKRRENNVAVTRLGQHKRPPTTRETPHWRPGVRITTAGGVLCCEFTFGVSVHQGQRVCGRGSWVRAPMTLCIASR